MQEEIFNKNEQNTTPCHTTTHTHTHAYIYIYIHTYRIADCIFVKQIYIIIYYFYILMIFCSSLSPLNKSRKTKRTFGTAYALISLYINIVYFFCNQQKLTNNSNL